MANHLRTQCRDAVVTLLTGLTTTGANVFAGRPQTRPLKESELPGLIVYTTETEASVISLTSSGRRMQDICNLVIEAFARGTGDIDATLDTIAKEVEAALAAAPQLGGLAKDTYLTGTVKDSDPEAQKPTWEIVLTYTCEYSTREDIPDAALA